LVHAVVWVIVEIYPILSLESSSPTVAGASVHLFSKGPLFSHGQPCVMNTWCNYY